MRRGMRSHPIWSLCIYASIFNCFWDKGVLVSSFSWSQSHNGRVLKNLQLILPTFPFTLPRRPVVVLWYLRKISICSSWRRASDCDIQTLDGSERLPPAYITLNYFHIRILRTEYGVWSQTEMITWSNTCCCIASPNKLLGLPGIRQAVSGPFQMF